jgi:hypothetical protein
MVKRFYPKDLFTRSAYAGAHTLLMDRDIHGFMDSISNVCQFQDGFTGSDDIGGFAEQPSELYARWIQLGVFILL